MKRLWGIISAGLTAVILLAACGHAQQPSSPDAKPIRSQDDRLVVYASFYPMYDFAVKIGGDKVNVINMVPAGTEPHDWEPTAADITGLEHAAVFIYSGAGMEHWVDDVLQSLQNTALLAVETSEGLHLLDAHHHDDGHDHGHYDPHIWLNPLNAKKQMQAIMRAFVKADPANKAYYEANYEKFALECETLDQEFKNALSALPKKEIIVSHKAFGYLCAAYGITQVGIEGLSPDSEPDPASIAQAIDFAKDHDVNVIFFVDLINPKIAETIAKATGAQTLVLSPIEGLSDEQQAAGADYFSMMRQNLAALKTALQ